MDDIIFDILLHCSPCWLYQQFKLLTDSPFYLEIRNKHFLNNLSEFWELDKKRNFFLEFDKKYFLTQYTNYEYRKDRLTLGFGYNRLFKYAVVNNIDIPDLDELGCTNYLFKQCYCNMNYLPKIGGNNILGIFKKAVKKGFSDAQILNMRKELENYIQETEEWYLTLEDSEILFDQIMTIIDREHLVINPLSNEDKAICLDLPELLPVGYRPVIPNLIKCPRILRSCKVTAEQFSEWFDIFSSKIHDDVIDYFREIGYYHTEICSRTIAGLKLLTERGIDYNVFFVPLLGWEWLHNNKQISDEEYDKILYCANILTCIPNDIIRIYQGREHEKVNTIKSIAEKLIA